ncbi:Trifunctional UDP-glucose 4,6-dehydratase/UDP-4-keto-6 (Partial), partial [Seminavis robusta]
MSSEKPMTKVLIFGGKTGWIGGQMHDMCKEKGIEVVNAETRIENRESLAKELDEVKPSHVLMSAGKRRRIHQSWGHLPRDIQSSNDIDADCLG